MRHRRPALTNVKQYYTDFMLAVSLMTHVWRRRHAACAADVLWWWESVELVDVDCVKEIVASVRRKHASSCVQTDDGAATTTRRHRHRHVEKHKARLNGVQVQRPERTCRYLRWRHRAVDQRRHWWRRYEWHVTCTKNQSLSMRVRFPCRLPSDTICLTNRLGQLSLASLRGR